MLRAREGATRGRGELDGQGAERARSEPTRKPPLVPACLVLVGLVILLYGRVARYEFVFDDLAVTESPQVSRGVTWEGLKWAFTHGYASNWMPLTWLSHMLDCELFGLRPAGHHLINVALHATNSALLLVVVHAMTGEFWPATAVATAFAVHPLRVESVAWVSERKDVLSTLFWFLTMLAYLRYVRRPALGRYLAVALFLGLGLLAKATLVTLPFVLLLLDVWPLRRDLAAVPARRLVAEKAPLLLPVAAASVATVLAGGGAIQTMATLPVTARVENAFVAYVAYLGKAIWPARLACFYPHPAIGARQLSSLVLLGRAVGAALALAAISAYVVRSAARRPYLAVGWLWYLGTLIPMIGLVQVGQQSMADRYTYVPLLGISFMVAWTVRDLITARPWARPVATVGTALALAAFSVVTWFQVATWRDNETLYRHALEVTANNHFAHYNLGNALLRRGMVQEAKRHFQQSIDIQPTQASAHSNLGVILRQEGKLQDAAVEFETALRIQPDFAGAHNNLGAVRLAQGRYAEAADHFRRSIALQPDYAEAHNGLGNTLLRQGRYPEATAEFMEALRLRPQYAEPHNGLGVLFAQQGDLKQAADHFERALRIDPGHAAARDGLARVRSLAGDR